MTRIPRPFLLVLLACFAGASPAALAQDASMAGQVTTPNPTLRHLSIDVCEHVRVTFGVAQISVIRNRCHRNLVEQQVD